MKNWYKKRTLLCALLALSWALGLTACASSGNKEKNTSGATAAAQTELQEKEEVNTAQTELPAKEEMSSAQTELQGKEEDTDQTELQEKEEADTEPETGSGSNILVAYFSATNNTEGVAQKLADGLDADLYEIMPEQPYTDEDLDYGDSNSRSSVEMDDPDARPEISGTVENMEQYDTVLIGYPIWWGEAPRIMSTFIESYDFEGKTLAAFCTSASSGFGSSDSALRAAADKAIWLDGKRFSAGASEEEVMEWVGELGVVPDPES